MIVLGTLDFIKAAAADDQDALKKNLNVFVRRCIAAVIVFIAPSLLNGIFAIFLILLYHFTSATMSP